MWRAILVGVFLLLLAVVVPSLMRARSSPGVQGGLGEVRAIVSAEEDYASINGGYFDKPTCLGAPSKCIPGIPSNVAPFLDPSLASLKPSGGYEFRFAAGPAPSLDDAERSRVSKSSLISFAVIAVPTRSSSQHHAFCGDSHGMFCASSDGTMPEVENGRCPERCKAL